MSTILMKNMYVADPKYLNVNTFQFKCQGVIINKSSYDFFLKSLSNVLFYCASEL